MIELNKVEFSIICKKLELTNVRLLDVDSLLNETMMKNGIESLHEKKIIEGDDFTKRGEYIAKTIESYSQGKYIVIFNDTRIVKIDNRYHLIFEFEGKYQVFNFNVEQLKHFFAVQINGMGTVYSQDLLN